MKKYLAVLLAVAVIVAGNVVGMAAACPDCDNCTECENCTDCSNDGDACTCTGTCNNGEECTCTTSTPPSTGEPQNTACSCTGEDAKQNGCSCGGTDCACKAEETTPSTPETPSSGTGTSSSTSGTTTPSTSSTATSHESAAGSGPVMSADAETAEANRVEQENAVEAIEAISAGEATNVKVQQVTTAAGTSVSAVTAKMYGIGASLSIKSMATVSDASVSLNVSLDNGAAEILIPAGFTMPNEPGVIGYSVGYQKDPLYTGLMTRQVKGDNAKTEVYRLGGGTLPTTATVTVKTKLTGSVNIYTWDEDTRRSTLLATATAEGGKVKFDTKQMGNMIITTGTI